ncbi:MAG: class I adenylate-forming enzyme family protein [Anaerolineales bacterium]
MSDHVDLDKPLSTNEFLFSRFEEICEIIPDHPAIIYLGEKYSFSKLKDLIDRFATAAADLGVQDNDRVILYIQNCVQWVIAYFGLQKIGAVPVPVSPIYTAYEVEYMANHSGATTIVCQDTNFGYVKRLQPKTGIEKIIVVNLVDILPFWKRAFGYLFDKAPKGKVERGEGIYFFRDLVRKYPPNPPEVKMEPQEHIAYILYTGGTTGFPKGVPGTHTSMVSFLNDVIKLYGKHIRPTEDVFILVNPLFHIMAYGMFLSLGLNTGCSTVIMPEPQIDAILDAIQRYKGTTFLGVPALYRMILENDRLDTYDLSSLRMCWSGGDTLPMQVFRRWEEESGVKIFQVYGSTEVGFVSMSSPGLEPSPQNIGEILLSRRFKIVDPETLAEVEDEQVGELLITSDHIIKEYWNNPEETRQSYVELDGEVWYRMGDYVRRSENEIRFIERSADLIKYKGYRVSASEIEAALQDHPAVVGACVVGIPDARVGERIRALVVLREDARGVGSADLIRWCRDRVAPYKVPHYIEFRDMLPKSKVGKLLRREVRAEESRRLSEEEASKIQTS